MPGGVEEEFFPAQARKASQVLLKDTPGDFPLLVSTMLLLLCHLTWRYFFNPGAQTLLVSGSKSKCYQSLGRQMKETVALQQLIVWTNGVLKRMIYLGRPIQGSASMNKRNASIAVFVKWDSDPLADERIQQLQELLMGWGTIREHTGRTVHRREGRVETILEACCAGHAGVYEVF